MHLKDLNFFVQKERLTANDYIAILDTVGKLHETMIIKIDKNNPRGKYIVSLPYACVEGKDLQKAVQEALRLFIESI